MLLSSLFFLITIISSVDMLIWSTFLHDGVILSLENCLNRIALLFCLVSVCTVLRKYLYVCRWCELCIQSKPSFIFSTYQSKSSLFRRHMEISYGLKLKLDLTQPYLVAREQVHFSSSLTEKVIYSVLL